MSIVKGVNVGHTDVTAQYSNSSGSVIVNVTPVSLYEIEDISSTVYDGTAQKPSVVVKAMLESGLSNALVEGQDYEVSYNNNTDVGTASVTVTGKGNYTGTLTKEWTIVNANITVDVSSFSTSTVYDGTNKSNPIGDDNVSLYGNQEWTVKYGLSEGSYTLDDCPDVVNVDDTKYIYFQITADNHNPVVGSYYVEITPKEAEVEWGETSWRYDGEIHSTTCTVTNLIGSDTCNVNMLYNSITNIGSVDVKADSLSNSNYMVSSGGLWQTITVLAAFFIKVSGTWTPVKRVYKKVSGEWELTKIDDLYEGGKNPFSTDSRYVQKTQGNGLNIENSDLNMNLD